MERRREVRTLVRWAILMTWIGAAVAAAIQSWAALARPLPDRLADLHVYVGSVRLLRDGGSLYDFAAADTGAPFTYPPFAGLVFFPLALVNEPLLRVMWTVATLTVIVLIATILSRAEDVRRWLPQRLARPACALLLLASAPVSSNLRFGQVSIFVVVLVLLDCLRAVPPRLAGLATGVASAVKLTPLIFIPFLWLSGQRRAALTATGTVGGATLLGWVTLPAESVRFWLTELWRVDRVGHISTGGNQSLNGMLLRLGVAGPARLALVAVTAAAVAVWALRRAAKRARHAAPVTAAAIVGAAGLVVSPVSWTHHQVWLVLAAVAAVSARPRRQAGWSLLVAALTVLPVTSAGADLPGGTVWGNARLLLAVAIACVVPFGATRGHLLRAAAGPASGRVRQP